MTRVPDLMATGVNVAFGHDCVMDPRQGLGQADIPELAHMDLHVAQMTSQQGMRPCFHSVTVNAAKAMQLEGYGLEVGRDASFVLLQARNPVLRSNRLMVWRKGTLVAETPEVVARLRVERQPGEVGFSQT